jgi:hypothetical protein
VAIALLRKNNEYAWYWTAAMELLLVLASGPDIGREQTRLSAAPPATAS